MTGGLIGALVAVLVIGGGLLVLAVRRRRPRPSRLADAPAGQRILFPFVANALSVRSLDTSLRIARAEQGTLVPVFLARVPLHLPLDAALPRQSAVALPLQEAIERRALAAGIPVDSRIERGRSYRHALRQTMARERFDRIVMAAAARDNPGFGPDDIAWVLANAPGEIVIVRPAHDELIVPPAGPVPARRRAPRPLAGQLHPAGVTENAEG